MEWRNRDIVFADQHLADDEPGRCSIVRLSALAASLVRKPSRVSASLR
jgi:hypothetical protein